MREFVPNIITAARIIGALALIWCAYPSLAFLVVFALCGVSDALDGYLARRLDAQSQLGSKLDTVADLALVVVCCVKILPDLSLPLWILLWVACIAVIKGTAFLLAYRKDRVEGLHSTANKAMGIALFASVFLFAFIDPLCVAVGLCAMATLVVLSDYHQLMVCRSQAIQKG